MLFKTYILLREVISFVLAMVLMSVYFFALFFGLIHGMGFANTLRFMLAGDQNLGWGLLGFNVGLEAGQIVVVIVLLVIAFILINLLKVNRREWVLFIAAAVFALSLQMALDRLPF